MCHNGGDVGAWSSPWEMDVYSTKIFKCTFLLIKNEYIYIYIYYSNLYGTFLVKIVKVMQPPFFPLLRVNSPNCPVSPGADRPQRCVPLRDVPRRFLDLLSAETRSDGILRGRLHGSGSFQVPKLWVSSSRNRSICRSFGIFNRTGERARGNFFFLKGKKVSARKRPLPRPLVSSHRQAVILTKWQVTQSNSK